MQKRVVGNINELNEASRKTAFEESANTAGTNRGGCKANKTSFGRFKKFAVVIMLLIVSVFCAIGSADWIISQQEQLPGGSGSTFVYDKKTLQNYIALKGSDETEAAAKVAEAEEYASLQTETDSDDSAVADKFTVKKAAVSKKSAVSTYATGLESAIYGKSAIYNGKPIVAVTKASGIDNAVAVNQYIRIRNKGNVCFRADAWRQQHMSDSGAHERNAPPLQLTEYSVWCPGLPRPCQGVPPHNRR